MYYLRCQNPDSFAIVLSPRKKGVKALCVHLTDAGFAKLNTYWPMTNSSPSLRNEGFFKFASSRIHESSCTFYCQIPFRIIDEDPDFIAADFREDAEVTGQLNDFVSSEDGLVTDMSSLSFTKV